MSRILDTINGQDDTYFKGATAKKDDGDSTSPTTSTTLSSVTTSTQQALCQLKLPSLSAGIGLDDEDQTKRLSTRKDEEDEEIRCLSSELLNRSSSTETFSIDHTNGPILGAATNSATTLVSSNTSARDIVSTDSPPHTIHSEFTQETDSKRSVFGADVDSKYGYRQFASSMVKKRRISINSENDDDVSYVDNLSDYESVNQDVEKVCSSSHEESVDELEESVDELEESVDELEESVDELEESSLILQNCTDEVDENELYDSQTSLPDSIIRQTFETASKMDQISPLTPGGVAVGSYGTIGTTIINNAIHQNHLERDSLVTPLRNNSKSIDYASPDRTTNLKRNSKYGKKNDILPRNPYYSRCNSQHKPIAPESPSPSYQNPYTEYPVPPPLPNTASYALKLHTQSFILALAFFACWSPQNLMAPNLTQMADYFHFTPEQRDLYLGANIAFATGVLSLPVSAMLGFLADIVISRKKLFAYTVMVGGISSICTGYSKTYAQLYLARFVCGGCMSGSVPIAFSILGDVFDAKDRNAASSGLTAMMGAGILMGQVFAGTVGDKVGWKRPFHWSGMLSIFLGLMVLQFVSDPVRGGKEKVLQEMIAKGSKYDRKLTLSGFLYAMTKNKTNVILMFQGFVTNIPWGVIFTFLNDYLSQEQGLSVPASTFLVFWFGIGSALGGVAGGFLGARAMAINRSLLPIFMAVTTIVGIFPFLGLLDLELRGHVILSVFLALTGGCVASLPSVNVRPCLLNVNPPETRGAAMTAANLLINVARGAGPSIITVSQMFGVSRQHSFNLTLIIFWTITGVSLFVLAKTLPIDQDAMDADLARYAASKFKVTTNDAQNSFNDSVSSSVSKTLDDIQLDESVGEESVVSITDRMTSFDAAAAQESLSFIGDALREIGEELSLMKQSQRSSYTFVDGHSVWNENSSGGCRRFEGLGPEIDMERGKNDNSQNGGFQTSL